MKKLTPSILLFLACVFGFPAAAQTNVPAPSQSTLSFNIGASALGLGGTSQATPASDVVLELNPGFKGRFGNFELRSDNILAPGINLQSYHGGLNYCFVGPACVAPFAKIPGQLAPLSFYADFAPGVDRIVPATGNAQSHFSYIVGGGIKWQMQNGIQMRLIEVDAYHAPGSPFDTAPMVAGGITYVWGNRQ